MFRGSLLSNAAMKDQQSQSVASYDSTVPVRRFHGAAWRPYDSSVPVRRALGAAWRVPTSASYDSSVPVRLVHGAAWRGTCNIPSLNLDINIAAHVSKNACSKVLEVASVMPASLYVELITRLDAWPASFEKSPPTEHSVALVFFPDGRDDVVDNLLNHTICGDYALKSMIGEAELLIFTSLQLPSNLHRFQGKPYFWGIFRGQLAASHQSDYYVHVKERQSLSPNSGNNRSSKRKGTPITISCENSSSSSGSSTRKRPLYDDIGEHATTKKSEDDGGRPATRGRQLDDAWIHATPLDEIKQKTRCNYCNFVSQYGGISRLKAHLGGASPQLQLPGCHQAPLEVKSAMEQWFNEWSKKSAAKWIPSSGSSTRKMPLYDDIGEHATTKKSEASSGSSKRKRR